MKLLKQMNQPQLLFIGTELMFVLILGTAISAGSLLTPRAACAAPVQGVPAPVAEAGKERTRDIDIAIALDVSGSMNGLLDSARQRIWDIINQFSTIKPRPNLRVALLTYGRDDYSSESGWVKIDQQLTTNLDAISESLFSYTTNGGTEYVARVVDKAVKTLEWSKDPKALRIVVVAGNEPATQDPQISIEAAMKDAVGRGIVVNPIFCGSESEGVSTGWQKVANLTDGIYASIDQNQAAVASIATPMDADIAKLNTELNDTYIAFGNEGAASHANQTAQDLNAAKMSAPSLASRIVAKSSGAYQNSNWDLVDAVKGGKKIEDLKDKDLPAQLQGKSVEERKAYVEEKSKKREEIQQKIGKLAAERNNYISAERSKMAAESAKGLDAALTEGLRKQAIKKGFTFSN